MFYVGRALQSSVAPASSPELDAEFAERLAPAPADQRGALYLTYARAAKLQNLDLAQALARLSVEAAKTDTGDAFDARLLLVDLELTGRKSEAAALNLDVLEQTSATVALQLRQAEVL